MIRFGFLPRIFNFTQEKNLRGGTFATQANDFPSIFHGINRYFFLWGSVNTFPMFWAPGRSTIQAQNTKIFLLEVGRARAEAQLFNLFSKA
jgi:hypothetical protein